MAARKPTAHEQHEAHQAHVATANKSGRGSGDAALITYIRQTYGYLAGLLAIPEIRKVLLEAAKNRYDPARLQGKLFATTWWKQTKEVTRKWIADASLDPAQAQAKITSTVQELTSAARQLGVVLSQQEFTDLAMKRNKYGWSDTMIQAALASHFDYDPDRAATGRGAVTVQALKQSAAQYFVPLSEATIDKWARDILGGKMDMETFQAYLVGQAKSRWPGLSEALDRGVTVAQYADPYKEIIAQELEQNPESVNLMDPKWMKAFDMKDPKTGASSAMSLGDFAEYVRRQPEYGKTRRAGSKAADFSLFLVNAFERGTGL